MSTAIKRIIPLQFPWQTEDPFLFCVHHRDEYPKAKADMSPDASLTGRVMGNDFVVKDGWRMYHGRKVPGFPHHPHRGFETITIAEEGFVDHSDSLGAAGRFSEGDVQWMTAGKGVLHSEMFPLLREDQENTLEIFQIWLNLPAKSKMVEPHFKMLWNEKIPAIKYHDENEKTTSIKLIAGTLGDNSALKPTPSSWAADPKNQVLVARLDMDAGANYTLPAASEGIKRTVYFYHGSGLKIDDQNIPFYHAVVTSANQEIQLTAGAESCKVLILQGKPINEPVAQYGPFVMNTKAEIEQAFDDYRQTGFGGWPWPEDEMVHSKEKGRFALHADGTVEEPV